MNSYESIVIIYVFFFFSSRRRHTRLTCDWSSDVCSSDLPSDRTKVSQYLDSIREIERRIQLAEKENGNTLPAELERPIGAPVEWEDHVKLMFDLQVLALQADITRVISFQLAREVSTRTYPQIGVPDAHHPTSHHQNDPEKIAKLAKINAYHVGLFAYFLDKMKSTPDGDGTLLDHSLYLLGS